MDYIPCSQRLFPFRINYLTFYSTYLRWLRHLVERIGYREARLIWENTFAAYDDQFLLKILSAGWRETEPGETSPLEVKANELIEEFFPIPGSVLLTATIRNFIEGTPPIRQIKQLFGNHTMEKEITAYNVLHTRFDGIACLAEALIDKYGKEGELIVYDLVRESRLAAGQGETSSVEEFIEYFTSQPETPNLFTAGLEIEVISKSENEAITYVRECEWARYFQERHPKVGYLIACSTDEAAYRAINPRLRLQRTGTIMEGSDYCDFRVYAVAEKQPE